MKKMKIDISGIDEKIQTNIEIKGFSRYEAIGLVEHVKNILLGTPPDKTVNEKCNKINIEEGEKDE